MSEFSNKTRDTIRLLNQLEQARDDFDRREVLELLFKMHSNLIFSIVNKLLNLNGGKSIDYDLKNELIAVGNIGLIESFERFDVSAGVEFSTFAFPTIRGTILKFINSNYLIRVNSRLSIQMAALRRGDESYFDSYRGKECKVSDFVKNISKGHLSLNFSSEDDDTFCFEPFVKSFEGEVLNSDFVKDALDYLNSEEREIIFRNIICEQSLKNIASDLNTSEVDISNLKNKAVKKLQMKFKKVI